MIVSDLLFSIAIIKLNFSGYVDFVVADFIIVVRSVTGLRHEGYVFSSFGARLHWD